MMNAERTQWLSTVVRVALAGIMLWAGVAKLFDPRQAVLAVRAYQLVPSWADTVVGVGLPIIEVTVGLLLLLGLGTRLAATVTGGLMILFIVGVASAWIRGLSIDCGCFGGGGIVPSPGKDLRYVLEILRDTGFLLMAAWLVRFPKSQLSMDGLTDVPIDEDLPDPDESHT